MNLLLRFPLITAAGLQVLAAFGVALAAWALTREPRR